MTPMIASILNFAGPDMTIILLIVFLLFGAKKLPELARGMGKAVKEVSPAPAERRSQDYWTQQASKDPLRNPGTAIRARTERTR
jgi:sec-independent protein translocase protein TatA